MHQGGVRLCRAMLISVATAGIFAWGFSFVSAVGPGELLISKIQTTGGTGKTSQDFVSLYNASALPIDLNGLRLVKRTKTGTTDTTLKSWVSPFLINSGTYYTWANSADGFADSIHADSSSTQTISDDNGIALRAGAENSGTIIDSVAWGAAANAYVETSPYAINPGANQVLTRINNQDTNNNSLDFTIPSNSPPPPPLPPTPVCGNTILENGETCDDGNILSGDGCSNICQIEVVQEIQASSGDIRINELVSDPSDGVEWIELYNNATREISVTDWTIEDGSGTKTILSGSIKALDNDHWLVVTKPKGALNNTGDTVILKKADGTIIDQMTYGEWDDGTILDNAPAAVKPFSLARRIDGLSTNNDSLDFAVTETITKGTANVITEPPSDDSSSNEPSYDYSRTIEISEIFPNPNGIDSEASNGEFVELHNTANQTIDLSGWKIEVDETFYVFPKESFISGDQYLIAKAFFPLPNDGASVKLYQPLKQTSFQSVSYKKAAAGQSYARFADAGWRWTLAPTPNQTNILAEAPVARFDIIDDVISGEPIHFDSSDSFLGNQTATYFWDFGDGETSAVANPIHIFKEVGKESVTLTVTTQFGKAHEIKKITLTKALVETTQEESQSIPTVASSKLQAVKGVKITKPKATTKTTVAKNQTITITGLALDTPGTFGSQYFYLLPDQGEPLYQIYNSKKLFPLIKPGDRLSISGTYSESSDGPRLKTTSAADIKIIGTENIEEPQISTSTDLHVPPYPRLAKISGVVSSKKTPRIFVTDATGDVEVYLAKGAKISSSNFSIGDKISVLGVLLSVNGQARLEPRSEKDIQSSGSKTMPSEQQTTASDQMPMDMTTTKPQSNKNILFLYLLAGSLITMSGIGYFMYKKK